MSTNLQFELISMTEEDQRVLQELLASGELPSEEYHPIMKAMHEKHTARLKQIIAEHGWPGIALVGKEGAKAAGLIAQHAVSDLDFMARAVELLTEGVAKNDVEGWQLAFLQDRVNTMAGKDQVYGTQFNIDDDGWPIPFPISNPEGVNARRKALGLNSLEERLAEMIEREKQRREEQDKKTEAG